VAQTRNVRQEAFVEIRSLWLVRNNGRYHRDVARPNTPQMQIGDAVGPAFKAFSNGADKDSQLLYRLDKAVLI
jgi:hypothetical protein